MAVLLKPAWRGMKTFAALLRESEGALCSLGRQLAVEYGPDIQVNTVLPGPILTAAWDGIPESDRARSVAATVTGASLVVDGGWSVMKESS